jgi:polyisoprenoid-binding protein YceI
MKTLSLFVLIFSFCAFPAKPKTAAEPSVLMEVNLEGSSIIINGDSNIKKWDTKANKFSGQGSFQIKDGALKKINSFTLTLDTNEIKSGSDSMDGKTAKALETEKFPQITCTLKSSTINGDTVTGSMEYNLHGIKKTFDINPKVTLTGNEIVVEGEQDISMTDFQITPPENKILFVTATAKPELKIKFKLNLKTKN